MFLFIKYSIQLCKHHIIQTFKILSNLGFTFLVLSHLISSYLVSVIYKFGLKVAPSPDSQTWQEKEKRGQNMWTTKPFFNISPRNIFPQYLFQITIKPFSDDNYKAEGRWGYVLEHSAMDDYRDDESPDDDDNDDYDGDDDNDDDNDLGGDVSGGQGRGGQCNGWLGADCQKWDTDAQCTLAENVL